MGKKIQLSDGNFSVIPEGATVLKIVDSNYDEDFGKLMLHMEDDHGRKHKETYSFLNKNGEPVEGAINAFSYFCRCAMGNFDMDECDPDDLVGIFIDCTIKHEMLESNKKPGRMLTFARIDKIEGPVKGFVGSAAQTGATGGAPWADDELDAI